MDETSVVGAAAVLGDRLGLNGRLGVGRVVIDLRAGVNVLALASERDGNVVIRRARTLQDRRWVSVVMTE